MNGNILGKLAQPASGAVNFINNVHGIIFQRGADYTFVNDTYGFAPDRWAGKLTGTAVTAGKFTRTNAAPLGNTGFAIHASGITVTGSGVIRARQRLEAGQAFMLRNKTLSLSFKAYHDVGSAITFQASMSKASVSNDFTSIAPFGTITSPATTVNSGQEATIKWEGITIGDCSNGLEIVLIANCGAVTNKNIYFTDVKLEINPVCTDFIPTDWAIERIKCQRYLQVISSSPSTTSAFGVGVVTGADLSTCNVVYTFKESLCKVPIFSYTGSFKVVGGSSINVNSITLTDINYEVAKLQCALASAGSSGASYWLSSNNDIGAKLIFDSEL